MPLDRSDFPPLTVEDFEAERLAHSFFAKEAFPPLLATFIAKKLEKERKAQERVARKRNAKRKALGAELDETKQSE